LVLLALTLAALALGGADGQRFENRAFGHTVLVPPGWTARLRTDGTTSVATYRSVRVDGFDRPAPRQLQVVLADYGALPCPRDAVPDGGRIELGARVRFEGFVGHTVAFCRGGHSLQAFVPTGGAVPAARLEQARAIVASLRLTARAHTVANRHAARVLGRSLEGRPIRVFRKGNPRSARRILVVGCIHGNECAGLAVTQRLVSLVRPLAADLWVLQNLNPDGLAHRTRGNARSVDLNRDFVTATQRETRIAQALIRRLRPDVTIWFHQPQAVVRAWGRSRGVARRYARLAGEPYRTLAWPPGAATRWQNGLGLKSFVVELPSGPLSHGHAERHARAVLRLADPLCCAP
jgi:murein peptide amidase A